MSVLGCWPLSPLAQKEHRLSRVAHAVRRSRTSKSEKVAKLFANTLTHEYENAKWVIGPGGIEMEAM
jgi:hypothetical protein